MSLTDVSKGYQEEQESKQNTQTIAVCIGAQCHDSAPQRFGKRHSTTPHRPREGMAFVHIAVLDTLEQVHIQTHKQLANEIR